MRTLTVLAILAPVALATCSSNTEKPVVPPQTQVTPPQETQPAPPPSKTVPAPSSTRSSMCPPGYYRAC